MLRKNKKLGILLLFFALLVNNAHAQFTSKRLVGIKYSGLTNTQEEYLASHIDLEIGKEFKPLQLTNTLKKLNKLGLFESIEVEAEESIQGLTLIFRVKENPIVNRIQFIKNTRYQDKDLIEHIEQILGQSERLFVGGGFSQSRLQKTEEAVVSFYHSKGYLYATVQSDILRDEENNLVTINIEVDEGSADQVRIASIIFHGLTSLTKREALKVMKTEEAFYTLFFYWSDGFYDNRILKEDLQRLPLLLANKGYINAVVEDHKISLNEDSEVILEITINEGIQYTGGPLTFGGNSIHDDKTIRDLIDVEEGAIYDKSKYDAVIARISSLYHDKGYIYALVAPELIANDEKRIARLHLTITEGPLVYLEFLNITGNTDTRDFVIRREFLLKPGSVFNRARVRKSMQKLYNLGFFKDIQLQTIEGSARDQLDLTLDVEGKKTGDFMFGMGYSTVDELTGNLSIAKRNLWGRGHSLRFAYVGGEKVETFSLSYTVPWFMGYNMSLGFDLYDDTRKYKSDGSLSDSDWDTYNAESDPNSDDIIDQSDNFDENREVRYAHKFREKGGAVRLGRPVGEDARISLRYRRDLGIYTLLKRGSRDSGYVAPYDEYYIPHEDVLPFGEFESQLLTKAMRLSFAHDTRDSVSAPREGHRFSSHREYAGGGLGGDFNFHKYGIDVVKFYPSFWKFVWGLRMRFHGVDAFGDSNDVPPSEKFSVGGPDTVRGYTWRSIADYKRRMLITNVEYRFPLEDSINAAFFWDAGNAWDSDEAIQRKELKSGIGIGLRIETPGGPRLKFDYGWGLNKDDGRKDRFDFSIGTIL